MCNVFDRIMTACLVALALSAAYVSAVSIQELNDVNNAPGRGVASTSSLARS